MNVFTRILAAFAAVISGFNARGDKLEKLQKQLDDERKVNDDLRKFIETDAPEHAALKAAKEQAESDLKTLRKQYDADTAGAQELIDKAETAAADANDDDDIPVTVNPDGTATHDENAQPPAPTEPDSSKAPAPAGTPGGDPKATAGK